MEAMSFENVISYSANLSAIVTPLVLPHSIRCRNFRKIVFNIQWNC